MKGNISPGPQFTAAPRILTTEVDDDQIPLTGVSQGIFNTSVNQKQFQKFSMERAPNTGVNSPTMASKFLNGLSETTRIDPHAKMAETNNKLPELKQA